MATVPFREPGWAEVFLPLQTIEVKNIFIDEPKKLSGPGVPIYAADRPISILSYVTPSYRMPIFSILTPFLKVFSWDSSTGRLELEIEENSTTAMKLISIQNYILSLLISKPQWVFPYTHTIEELKENFQEMIHGNILTIYLHGPNPEKKQNGRVWIWKEDRWQKGVAYSSFTKDQYIRVALRLQGICFLQTHTKKMRYRIQHQTVSIFHMDSSVRQALTNS